MTRTTAASRLLHRKVAVGLMAVVLAPLAVTAGAHAATFTPADGPALEQAINDANLTAASDTIILANNVQYQPLAPLNVTNPLTITGDHATQFSATLSGPTLDGGQVVPQAADFLTITAAGRVDLQGFTLQGGTEGAPFAAIRSTATTVRMDNMLVSGNGGTQFAQSAGGIASINNSFISDGLLVGINSSSSTLILNNATVSGNQQGGVAATGSFRMNNSIVSGNLIRDCFNRPSVPVASLDSDLSCLTAPNGGGQDPLLEGNNLNGGPTQSIALLPGSPAIDTANNSLCPLVDERFFVRTDGLCDKGAYEVGAVRDTTAPTCVVTALRPGPPAQQDVTAADSGSTSSGLGNTAITDEVITNGSIAFSPFSPINNPQLTVPPANPTASTRTPLVLTATKADQGQLTRWSFTATDWAGNVKDCR